MTCYLCQHSITTSTAKVSTPHGQAHYDCWRQAQGQTVMPIHRPPIPVTDWFIFWLVMTISAVGMLVGYTIWLAVR